MRLALLFLSAILLAGCVWPEREGAFVASEEQGASVAFVAWGDAGHGTPAQHAFAESVRRACAAMGCDLALSLGDNVYEDGVTGVGDPDFVEKFEAPFANLSMPIWVVLGNHDVMGSAQAQVDYSNVSSKWRMPARSYAFQEDEVAFVALDLTRLDQGNASGADALGAWTDAAILDARAGGAQWVVAFSHFPYVSNGKDGSPEVRAFLDRHVCGKADLYLAGHEHSVQWLAQEAGCAGTELVVSGGATDARPLAEEDVPTLFASDENGTFVAFETQGDALVGRALDGEGRVLFEREVRGALAGGASSLRPPASGP